jgi:TonB family protein
MAHRTPIVVEAWPFPLLSALHRTWTILGALTACVLLAPFQAFPSSPLLPEDIRIDILRTQLFGSLPTNRGLTMVVQVHGQAADSGEQLVAMFESPAFAQQISPLVPDSEGRTLTTTVAFGPISPSIGTPPKAAPVHIAIARQRGSHFEERARRTIFVTVAVPGYVGHGSRQPVVSIDEMAFEIADSPQFQEPASEALPAGRLEEKDLAENSRQNQADGYWRMLNGMIHRQIDRDAPSRPATPARRMPIVHFRLYTNGEAQLIEIERSSGDLELDQSAILAVVNAHPFPPLPAGSLESHVDVHVNMPVPSR